VRQQNQRHAGREQSGQMFESEASGQGGQGQKRLGQSAEQKQSGPQGPQDALGYGPEQTGGSRRDEQARQEQRGGQHIRLYGASCAYAGGKPQSRRLIHADIHGDRQKAGVRQVEYFVWKNPFRVPAVFAAELPGRPRHKEICLAGRQGAEAQAQAGSAGRWAAWGGNHQTQPYRAFCFQGKAAARQGSETLLHRA
jgi:hypothetical protein